MPVDVEVRVIANTPDYDVIALTAPDIATPLLASSSWSRQDQLDAARALGLTETIDDISGGLSMLTECPFYDGRS